MVLVTIGVVFAPFLSFPIGIAMVNPTQHFVNVVGAVLLGPWWAVIIATIIGIIRNVMGVGTLLAFPGGMIGALLSGLLYQRTRKLFLGATGEILGTVAPALLKDGYPVTLLAEAQGRDAPSESRSDDYVVVVEFFLRLHGTLP